MRSRSGLMSVLAVTLLLTVSTPSFASALLEYVARPEEVFNWRLMESKELVPGITVHFLEFTSQKWQGMEWKHRLRLIEPAGTLSFRLPFLFITGSGDGKEELEILGEIARALKIPIAVLHDIPNQPLFGGKYEDAIIAHTFAKFLKTGDPTWPLLLPMTKAAVRAMDVIEAFVEGKKGEKGLNFVVSGTSKRGWTTWLTAAVDERVKGIIPIVYDNLNLKRQMEHQIEVWGKYSEQIHDYTELNLPAMLSKEEGVQLAQIVDPYFYLDRISIPKLIVIGTNDRYWPIDALNIYYSDLVGPKYIYYAANAGHGLKEEEPEKLVGTISAFYLATAGLLKLPELSWTTNEAEGALELTVMSRPAAVKVDFWVAHSPTRDFRNAKWNKFNGEFSAVAGGGSESKHRYTLGKPETGWSALYAEVHYQFLGYTFSLCTQVNVISGK